MKKLNTVEEIEEFASKNVVKVFGNFEQLENGYTDKKAIEQILATMGEGYKVNLFAAKNYIDNEDDAIYDLGNNYYMLAIKRAKGLITSIYKVIE